MHPLAAIAPPENLAAPYTPASAFRRFQLDRQSASPYR
jgi:hypothetical protein